MSDHDRSARGLAGPLLRRAAGVSDALATLRSAKARFSAIEAEIRGLSLGHERLAASATAHLAGLQSEAERSSAKQRELLRAIEQLAHSHQVFAGAVREQLGAVVGRMGQLEAAHGELGARFHGLEAAHSELEARFRELEARFHELEARSARSSNALEQAVADLERAQTAIGATTARRAAGLRPEGE